MKRKLQFICCLLLSFAPSSPAQEYGLVEAVMTLLGVTEEESLDDAALEPFERLASHPLPINSAPMSRMESCGLFSQYQIASLADYRQRNGDVLSFEELGTVPGFPREYVKALRLFITLEPHALPGTGVTHSRPLSIESRTAVRKDGVIQRVKASYGYGEGFGAAVAISPGKRNFSLSYDGRGVLERLVVGDFNARFGQGLALWSGMTMAGISAPVSAARHPSGVTAATAYSDTGLRGVASVLSGGRFALTALAAFPWLRTVMDGNQAEHFSMIPAMNLRIRTRDAQFSLTGMTRLEEGCEYARLSADWRFCLRGIDGAGEVASDLLTGKCAAIALVSFPMLEHRMAFQGRWYPTAYPKEFNGAWRSTTYATDEAGMMLSFGDAERVYGADLSRKLSTGRMQLKLLVTDRFAITDRLSVKPRINCRFRTEGEKPRTDIRTDWIWSPSDWSNVLRINWLHCKGDAWMAYSETSYRHGNLALHLRAMVYRVDNWDDRIYAYERGVPGSFSIPALYGRGWRLNFAASWKTALWKGRLKLYASGYLTGKRGKAALEASLVYEL